MKVQRINLYVDKQNKAAKKDTSITNQTSNYLLPARQNHANSTTFTALPLLKQVRAAENAMFRPFKGPNNINKLSEFLQKRVNEVRIVTKDGISLDCWDIPPIGDMPYFLYCHGLKKNLTMSKELLEGLSKEGFGILGVEYRGYAGNAGVSSRENHILDTKAALKYLTNKKNIPHQHIMIIGESLGGAIAVDLAARNKHMMGLIDISSMSDGQALVKHNFTQVGGKNKVVNINLSPKVKRFYAKMPKWVIPLKSRYNSLKGIPKIKYPILFVHSKHDKDIPCKMSVEMANLARKTNPHVELKILDEGDHVTVKEKLQPIIDFTKQLWDNRG